MFINPDSISEQLLFNTIRIQSGSKVGTGFIFSYKLNETKTLPIIITNKHVVSGCEEVKFCLHEAEDLDGKTVPSSKVININYKSNWFDHPDTGVDLCASLFQPLVNQIQQQQNKKVFYIPADETIIPSQEKLNELSAVEDTWMIGYPVGLFDSHNNLPLIRKGITSSHPALDFQGKKIGVVDLAVFPGSSGSPIFIANQGSYGTKKGTIIGSRIYLLGVLFGGPVFNAEGEVVVSEVPTNQEIKSHTQVMINLGYYVKSKEIIAMCDDIKSKLLGTNPGLLNL